MEFVGNMVLGITIVLAIIYSIIANKAIKNEIPIKHMSITNVAMEVLFILTTIGCISMVVIAELL